MEYYFKRTFYGEGISAVPPDEYSERFVSFIDGVVFMKPSKTFKYKEIESMSGRGDMMEDEWIYHDLIKFIITPINASNSNTNVTSRHSFDGLLYFSRQIRTFFRIYSKSLSAFFTLSVNSPTYLFLFMIFWWVYSIAWLAFFIFSRTLPSASMISSIIPSWN